MQKIFFFSSCTETQTIFILGLALMFYKKKLTIPARLWQIYIKIITIIINSLGIQRYVTTKTNKPKEFLLPRP